MYKRTNWVNDIWNPQNRVTLTDKGGGQYEIAKAGEHMQTGTPQDKDHFNNMENGLADVCATATFLIVAARQLQTDLEITNEMEKHSVSLTNTARYPFNNSGATVALTKNRNNLDYTVEIELVSSSGIVGGVKIYDKQLNGFKVSFWGSATAANVLLRVTGGI